jgi:CRP/FNR family transcriptional regulator
MAFMSHQSPQIQHAIDSSMLGSLPPSLRNRMVNEAVLLDVPVGSTIYRDDDAPRCALVVSGLVRVMLSASDGRSITVRYARAGELLGVPAIVAGPVPVSVHLVTPAQLLMLNVRTLGYLGKTEPEVAWMFAREIARRLYDTLDAVADTAFGSLRQRVARHLLDLAMTNEDDNRLIVSATQQALADAVGSARPAVARVIAELRSLGLLSSTPPGITILDAAGLHAQTWSYHMSHG